MGLVSSLTALVTGQKVMSSTLVELSAKVDSANNLLAATNKLLADLLTEVKKLTDTEVKGIVPELGTPQTNPPK